MDTYLEFRLINAQQQLVPPDAQCEELVFVRLYLLAAYVCGGAELPLSNFV